MGVVLQDCNLYVCFRTYVQDKLLVYLVKTVWTVQWEAEEQSPTLNRVGGKDFHDLYHVWHFVDFLFHD